METSLIKQVFVNKVLADSEQLVAQLIEQGHSESEVRAAHESMLASLDDQANRFVAQWPAQSIPQPPLKQSKAARKHRALTGRNVQLEV